MPLQVLNVTNEVYVLVESGRPILVTRHLDDAKEYLDFCVEKYSAVKVSDWQRHGDPDTDPLSAVVQFDGFTAAAVFIFRCMVTPPQQSVEEQRALDADIKARVYASMDAQFARTPEQDARWKDMAARYLARLKSEGYLTFPEVVRRVLREEGGPLTAQQIAERAAAIPGCPKYVEPFADAIRHNLERAARDPEGGMLGLKLVETQIFNLVEDER